MPRARKAEENMLLARNLSKSYPDDRLLERLRGRRKTVFSGLSLSLLPGQLVWLRGDNGCGKSTLLRVLGGFLGPDSGSMEFSGADLAADSRARRKETVLVTGEDRSFYWRLSCFENLYFFTSIARPELSAARVRELIREEMERWGLTPYSDSMFSRLSSGFIQRMALARGLLRGRNWLFLDEADRQLDAGSRLLLAGRVRAAIEQGAGAIWVSHRPPEGPLGTMTVLELDAQGIHPRGDWSAEVPG